MTQLVLYAGKNPWEFLYMVLICLSPLFALSAYMSYRLAKEIDKEDKEKRKRAKREASIAKSKAKASATKKSAAKSKSE